MHRSQYVLLDDVPSPGALLYMERYVDEGAKSYSPFAATNEADPQYQPRSHTPSFEAITVVVPRDRVTLFQASPSDRLVARYVRPEGVLFAVHPDTWNDAGVPYLDELRTLPRGEPLRVAPTASTRTVLVLDPPEGVPPHYLKLHFPRRISRFNRRLRRTSIQNSVAVTGDLVHIELERFAYLPDVLGCVYGEGDESWGFLVREATPRPLQRDRALVPCFALFGGDLDHPTHAPLVVQLIARAGASPEDYLAGEILIPLVEAWARVVRERGLLLESHAQNTLLELDADLRPRRIVHRDCDVWIDAGVRRRAGLAMPFRNAQIGAEHGEPIEPHYSLIYDHFLGRELFDYLLAAVARFHPIDEDAVRARVRAAFHRAFPDADRFFPAETTFYFSNEVRPENDYALVDTGEPPRWR